MEMALCCHILSEGMETNDQMTRKSGGYQAIRY